MKWLKRIGLALLVLLLVLGLFLWWLLGSNAGLRFALARAEGFTGGALRVQQAQGTLAGPLQLSGLHYTDGKGLDVTVQRASVDLELAPLLGKRLHIDQLDVQGVAVTLPPTSAQPSNNTSLSLKPPVAIQLDQAQVRNLSVTRARQPLFTANQLDLAGRWSDQGVALDTLRLRSPRGTADLHGRLVLGKQYSGQGQADFQWSFGQNTVGGHLQVHSDGDQAHLDLALTQPTAAHLQLALTQHGHDPWTATLSVPRFDPTPILGPGSLQKLGLDLKGQGEGLAGTLTGNVELNAWQLRLAPLRGRLSADHSQFTLDTLALSSPQIPGELQASGQLQLDAQPISGQLQLAWQDLQLPADLAGQVLASHGSLSFKGSAEQFHAEGKLALGPPGKLAPLTVDLDGTPQQIALHTLEVQQAQGHLQAQGTLDLKPVFGWQLAVDAHQFDPGQLLAGWNGALDAHLQTHGTLPAGHPDAVLDLAKLDGRLRGRALRGHGHLHLAPSQVLDGDLTLASDRSTVTLHGEPGPRNDVQLQLRIASLGDWLQNAGGSLQADAHVTGLPPALGIDGQAHGHALSDGSLRIGTLALQAHVPDLSRPSGKLTLDARQAWFSGLAFNRLSLDAGGTEAAHRLQLSARGRQLSADLALRGSLVQGRWKGTLDTLDLDPQGLPSWRLQSPATLTDDHGALALSSLCLTAGDPRLCVQGSQDTAGNLAARYQLRALPLALLLNAAGYADLPLRVDGSLHGDGSIKRSAAGALSGQATLGSDQGTISYTPQAQRLLLAWRDLTVTADLAPGKQHAQLHASLNHNGRLDGHLSIDGKAQVLSGALDVTLDSLAPLELLTSEVANVQGRLDGHFGFAGTLAQPLLTGQATVDGLAAEVPALGLKLADGALVLRAPDAQQLLIDGHVRSGKGTLAVHGGYALAAQASSRLQVQGQHVTVADIPAATVVLSPDLTLEHSASGLDVTGAVTVDRAKVNLDHLPGAGATHASPDVVVVDERAQEKAAAQVPISARVKVDLGQHTQLSGKGLNGTLKGVLTVIEQPGRATRGEGQIAVDGTYKAYGQDLQIEQGQLLFAGTPIDNPGLNIRAVRKLNPNATIDEGQEVGLLITGTAQRPILTVFSNPPMEQSDALAYLITGKPLSQVSSGEGNVVDSAAQALGSAAGNLLAKSVGSRLGIDDIGVSSNQALGGESAFTVGKYLSPRLYLSYGVGLFEPGQVITLRYRIGQRWNLEIQNATDFSRASFNYRYEH